jgi:hypothetical protein
LGEGVRGGISAAILGLRVVTDDSVFGVVELQSVPSVVELHSIRIRHGASRSVSAVLEAIFPTDEIPYVV